MSSIAKDPRSVAVTSLIVLPSCMCCRFLSLLFDSALLSLFLRLDADLCFFVGAVFDFFLCFWVYVRGGSDRGGFCGGNIVDNIPTDVCIGSTEDDGSSCSRS